MDLCLTMAESKNGVLNANTISPCGILGSTTSKPGDCNSDTDCFPSDYSY